MGEPESKGSDVQADLVKQVEYYMSDDNLKGDRFFYDELKKHKEQWVRSVLLLRCNKVKKLTTKMQDVIAACRASDKLIVSDDGTRFRRKELFDMEKNPYPTLSHNKALVKVAGLGPEVEWPAVKAALAGLGKVAFVRVRSDGESKGDDGKKGYAYVALFCNGKPEDEVVKAVTDASVKVDGVDVTVTAVEDKEKEAFWEAEKSTAAPKKNSKRRRDGSGGGGGDGKSKRPTFGPVTIGDEEFKTTAVLRARVHTILHGASEDALSERDSKLVSALLEYHPSAADKKKNAKAFSVGNRPEYPDTKCFFVVREDGSKEDFSWVRCATAVEESLSGAGDSPAKRARPEPKGTAISTPVTAAAPLKYAGDE